MAELSAELYEQMAEAEELDATIKKILQYGCWKSSSISSRIARFLFLLTQESPPGTLPVVTSESL